MVKILGLQYGKTYIDDAEVNTLRYGHLMIMADQDQDGSHIKGLVINFIHTNWPHLLKRNFVEEFITPLVKVRIGFLWWVWSVMFLLFSPVEEGQGRRGWEGEEGRRWWEGEEGVGRGGGGGKGRREGWAGEEGEERVGRGGGCGKGSAHNYL